MRRVIAVLGAAFLVVALGTPALADSGKSPSDQRTSAMRDRDGDHGGGRHGDRDDFRHGDRDRDNFRHDRDSRHDRDDFRHDRRDYSYPYYYDGYYDNYNGSYSERCRWAYYHDRYWFDRYCGHYDYDYGSYSAYSVSSAPDAAAPAGEPISVPEANPAPDQTNPAPDMTPAPETTPAPD